MRELSLNVLDVAQNSLTAGATLTQILVQEDTAQQRLTIQIIDNGKGMTAEQVAHVMDPFYTTRTTRKVGLGVPLFKLAAEQTGGSLSIQSTPGQGTQVTAVFCTGSIDMTPLGDINATVAMLVRCNPERDFVFRRGIDGRCLLLDTRQLRQVLGDEVALDSPDVMEWVEGFLQEQTQALLRGENPGGIGD
ncbi:MAG TPA: sensor histidine kinase [Candidatus Gallacutalibacter stercoravium]|nr:sensor histidine kinase [Candidatus Gallacutalibacter stercoravium]